MREQNFYIPREQLQDILEIDTEIVSDFAPFIFEFNREKVICDNQHSRPYVITKYNNKPKGNWFSRLRKLSGDITLSHYYTKANGNSLNDFYNQTIKNKQAQIERTYDPATLLRLKNELRIATTQLEQALEENTTYLYLYTYALIQGKTEERLNALCDKFETCCSAIGIKAITPYTRIDEAFWSCLPLQTNEVPEYTYTIANSISASSIFPFDDNELSVFTENMMIEGVNKDTENMISIDYTNKRVVVNRNKFIFGSSGGGKTTYINSDWMKKLAFADNSKNLQQRIILFDPEDEQVERVKLFGGEVIPLSSMSDTRINPFQIFSNQLTEKERSAFPTDDEYESYIEDYDGYPFNQSLSMEEADQLVNKKLNSLVPYFTLIDSKLTDSQLSIIKTEAKKLYGTFYERRNLENLANDDFPVFSDLYEHLQGLENEDRRRFEKIESFVDALEDFAIGTRTIFNGYTNIDLRNPLICFSLRDLQTEIGIRDLAYLNAFQYLFEDITNHPEISTWVYADEFHFLLKNEVSADFFFQAYKRFRKYNAACTASSQQISDVFQAINNIGKAIIGNSFTKIFFGLEESEAEEIIRELRLPLTRKEVAHLTARRQGEGLIFHGTKRAKLIVKLTPEELRLLNPVRYSEEYDQPATQAVNWLARIQ
ncbi:VirB4 family type IV secretion system protein [Enterococcus faecalis]|uniref:VirB4 family type IV secretion system protein n=1 Tax=Enterococcus faecalis TaxID=1351 RepID=UPI0007096F0A|nr:TrsE protein [Enterococcus faecalis]KXF71684.1 TrsE protein [Enterococcus faecalis]MBC2812566.1 TrsE protein [Enterococcus faecalis]